MKQIKIPKRNGTFRIVVCPSSKEKQENRKLIPYFTQLALLLDVHKVSHGFVTTRSPVTNAKCHIGYEYSLCFDLKDFFDTVTEGLLQKLGVVYFMKKGLPKAMFESANHVCVVDKVFRQGIPTSPSICNIAFSVVDKRIMRCVNRLKKRGYKIVYTRYADDLTFSFDDPKLIKQLRRYMPICCKKFGFTVNHKKTHCQWARNGRRNITGVMVDDKAIYPTKRIRRRFRAAKKNNTRKQINGLGEWCKLKEPNWVRTVGQLLHGNQQDQLLSMMIQELHS